MVRAYVVNETSTGNVSVIDVNTHCEIARFTVSGLPTNIAVTPDVKLAYINGGSGTNSVTVIDIKTHSVIARVLVESCNYP
ncbi:MULTISPECIES: hypothetical protein [Bacillaceae]|uniref:YncE family protein n=1 Tax=Bacillaceae TaxID=186817 RepID=UPI002A14B430|nr:hypothetical protein [Cytobacillus sp. IB215316]MDX8362455.1 hypothetical protein [Cytobacillus sp. IB215316]